MTFANLQTKARHHFPRQLLQELEEPFNTGEEDDNDRTSVAFIVWDKFTPQAYSVVFYRHGHQVHVQDYTTDERPLEIEYKPIVA